MRRTLIESVLLTLAAWLLFAFIVVKQFKLSGPEFWLLGLVALVLGVVWFVGTKPRRVTS